MIKKIGSRYCLFTSDGKKRLGCHPTKAAALAQERAVQVRKRAKSASARPFDLVTLREMADVCPECADEMRRRGLAAVSVQALSFAFPEGVKKGLEKKIGRRRKGFRTRCMKLVSGKVSNPGAFCNALKLEVFGTVKSHEFFDPQNDATGPSREFLRQMFSILKGSVTKSEFDDAVKKARARAGGIMSGRKRKRAKERPRAS